MRVVRPPADRTDNLAIQPTRERVDLFRSLPVITATKTLVSADAGVQQHQLLSGMGVARLPMPTMPQLPDEEKDQAV